MPRDDYKTCKGCKRHVDEVGALSHTRLCGDCWPRRFEDNLTGLTTMSGPYALHWRQRIAASVGAVLPDKTT